MRTIFAARSNRDRGRLCICRLESPLPVIPIPLCGKAPDFPLALQPILDTAYERGGYDLVVDYGKPPDPPLARKAAGWAKKQLAKWTPE